MTRLAYEPLNTGDIVQKLPRHGASRTPWLLIGFVLGAVLGFQVGRAQEVERTTTVDRRQIEQQFMQNFRQWYELGCGTPLPGAAPRPECEALRQ